MLHLSDIHLDHKYRVGSLATCDSYLCCREEMGFPTDPADQAGLWGAYFCDLPIRTFRAMLEDIIENHGDEIDGVFWTGDNSPHDVWEQDT